MRFDRMILFAIAMAGASRVALTQTRSSPQRARLTEDLRLDATAEDFPVISRIFVSPDKRLLIPFAKEARIRVYDSTGKNLGSIGRKGSGPGEFSASAIYLGWKADTLWVDDGGQRRVSYFGPDLRLIRTVRYPQFSSKVSLDRRGGQSSMIVNISPLSFALDGSIVAQAYSDFGAGLRDWGSAPILVRYPTKGPPQYLADLPSVWDSRYAMTALGFGDLVPFIGIPIVKASANGDRIAHLTSSVSGDSGTFTATVLKATGDTMFTGTFPFAGIRIPQIVRDSALFAIKPREGPPELAKRFFEIAAKRMPRVYPGVEFLVLGLDNTVWIGLHTALEGQTVLVLNNKGVVIGTVLMPSNSKLKQATREKIWATQKDDDDLVSVVRYRVSGLTCAPTDCQ